MPEEDVIVGYCSECNAEVLPEHRFCHNCGTYLSTEPVTINVFNNQDLRRLFIFYFIYLFVCLLIKHTSWFRTYDEVLWFELVLAVVTTRFAWFNWSQIKPVIRFNHFNWKTVSWVVILAVLGSYAVSIGVRELNGSFFHTEISYFDAYKTYSYPVVLMIYSIAIMPALFEELAFRGVMYNYCSKFLDERLVVAVTAFLFAIMHLNLMSLVWLIPFAFFMGHLRHKYQTIWYGVIFHFTFNLTACLLDLYRQGQLF